jgi:hypothetical protein
MIHPKTKLVHINDNVGYGLFATDFIPEGTITYIKDSLELEITPAKYHACNQDMKNAIDKYSYRDEKGNYIVSWDMGKYVNHCCTPNTISTGYGFEIAIRDIFEGEQITDEYGIFNLEDEMMCECGSPHCRKIIQPEDFDNLYPKWDEQIKSSLLKLKSVDQPLVGFMDAKTKKMLQDFFANQENYRSVYKLRFHNPTPLVTVGKNF